MVSRPLYRVGRRSIPSTLLGRVVVALNLLEHSAKFLLRSVGIMTPQGAVVTSPDQAVRIASELGSVMVKAQVPAGGRGRSGGILRADRVAEARQAAASLIGRRLGPHRVREVLVEHLLPVEQELYAAVMNHVPSRSIRIVFSVCGGVEVEDTAGSNPTMVHSLDIDPRSSLGVDAASGLIEGAGYEGPIEEVAATLVGMHTLFRDHDAELIEINPLAVIRDGRVVALDCKFSVDPSAAARQTGIASMAANEPLTPLEESAREAGLKLVELDGDIGVLANGAGLTMTTMDVISQRGGRPANFLEIGGDAYTKARPALELVLQHPRVRSLVVNFCGAFARTDVMVDGLTQAWLELQPEIPAFFTVHGTGSDRARRLLGARLGLEPYPTMDEAVEAAIGASRGEA